MSLIGVVVGLSTTWDGHFKFQWLSLLLGGIWFIFFLISLYISVSMIQEIFEKEKKSKPNALHVSGTWRTKFPVQDIVKDMEAVKNGTYKLEEPHPLADMNRRLLDL